VCKEKGERGKVKGDVGLEISEFWFGPCTFSVKLELQETSLCSYDGWNAAKRPKLHWVPQAPHAQAVEAHVDPVLTGVRSRHEMQTRWPQGVMKGKIEGE
jgi:hypothetical protein